MRNLDRFWAKVDVRGPDECWEWKAGRYHDNYGMLGVQNQGHLTTMRAHVFALILATAEDAWGRYCLHTCDNPPCCNPAHLYWGTQRQNIADMDRRGRSNRPIVRGEQNSNARLTEADVRAIRAAYATGRFSQQKLGNSYGVSQAVISGIVRNKAWTHVSD